MTDSISLAGQIAVVTGGSRGIGRQIAKDLAAAGAIVAVTGRSRENLDETVAVVQAEGGQASAFIMDVVDTAQVHAVMQDISTQLGPIDLLVNNAGIGAESATPWEVHVDDWWRVLEVNVRGAFACAHAVMPGMVERKRGRIINVGSNAGLGPAPMATAYSVSKAALLRLGENLAASLSEHNISVFTFSPGLVYTDMTKDIHRYLDIQADDWVPVERAGAMCVFLASGQADKLSGRYFHAKLDDVDDIVQRADAIIEDDLHAMRLRR